MNNVSEDKPITTKHSRKEIKKMLEARIDRCKALFDVKNLDEWRVEQGYIKALEELLNNKL